MQFAKNTQHDTSEVLRLPRKMTMDTSKVLHLPRKLQHIFWKRRKSIALATQNDFRHVAEHVWMSRSATPATRNEATTHWKPPKMTTSAELPIGTAIRSSYGRLRTVADGCDHKRNVERTHLQPPDPQSETGTLATHSGKYKLLEHAWTLASIWFKAGCKLSVTTSKAEFWSRDASTTHWQLQLLSLGLELPLLHFHPGLAPGSAMLLNRLMHVERFESSEFCDSQSAKPLPPHLQFCLHLPLQGFHPLLQAHLPLFRAVSLGKKETLFWDALSTAPLKLAKVHAKCVISELSQLFTIAFDSTLILAQQPNSLHLCNFLLAICQVAFLFHQQLINSSRYSKWRSKKMTGHRLASTI